MPPRHGKSDLCSQYFPAWYLGRHPKHRVILASYEAAFAASWGEKTRDIVSEFGPEVFGMDLIRRKSAMGNWRVRDGGGMLCTGVSGGFTGRGADLLIIDDPVKNADEALSETFRQRHWDWYASTARTRLEPGGVVMLIMTRWNQDDLAGRVLARAKADPRAEQWDELRLPAIAEPTIEIPDALGRSTGTALWPWRYDRDALLAIKASTTEHWWNALFQQRPSPPGGTIAKGIWFPIVRAIPAGVPVRRCRFWDCAGTEPKRGEDPDWTCGTRVAQIGPLYYIEDVIRVRLTAGEVDKLIKQTATLDGPACLIREEQEPGSAGLAVIEARKGGLAGYDYRGVPSHGAKETRWSPMLVQAEVGNIKIVAPAEGMPDWIPMFLAEVNEAPYGAHDDQLDASAGAFNTVALERRIIHSATW